MAFAYFGQNLCLNILFPKTDRRPFCRKKWLVVAMSNKYLGTENSGNIFYV